MLSKRFRHAYLTLATLTVSGFAIASPTFAQGMKSENGAEAPTPPILTDLQRIREGEKIFDGGNGVPLDIRLDAQREAALSFGARGGFNRRLYEIRQELEVRERYLDKVFDFAQLLIPAPSGLMIEPPIVTEAQNAMLIDGGGQQAAVSDRIYNIFRNAQIVSTPRTWRIYLQRSWGEVALPPDILVPQNSEERDEWVKNVKEGWEFGTIQANESFEDDMNRLVSDFEGMVRYRMLLSQGMISPPYALQVDRGVTGGGGEMRVGDRAVQITGVPELIPGSQGWQPASR